jgi:DNA-binding winged helix-turn-helix (wHTH) protein/tetratricopeptide (TPR) repeat protein
LLSILIVHPTAERRQALAERLQECGYAVAQASGLAQIPSGLRVDAWVAHPDLSVGERQQILGRIATAKELVDSGSDSALLQALAQLCARSRPLLRLSKGAVDLRAQQLLGAGPPVSLTERESALLAWLLSRQGMVVSRGELLERVWGYRADMVTRTVDVTVARLREKIERDKNKPEHLLTVRGEGYRLVVQQEPARAESQDLLGRTEDLTRLRRAVGPGRLVTLVGPGGVGKTTLAKSMRGEACLWVELEGVAQGASTAMARALDLPNPGGATPESLAHALAHRGLELLVLDNAEHLVGETSALAEALLVASPGLSVLVTSRVPMGAAVEVLFRVKPLAPTAAQALFMARAQARSPAWQAEPEALADIVSVLDGLPLALELAAGRAGVLSAVELLERIQASTSWLGSGDGSLQRAVELSWGLLDDQARQVLKALSVFRGGATLWALEAMLELPPGQVAQHIQGLLDHGLIRRAKGRLWPFIGVAERARQASLGALRERHARVFSDWVLSPKADVFGPAGWEALLGLQAERENLLLALEHSARPGDLALGLLHEWEVRDAPAHEVAALEGALEGVRDPQQRARGLRALVFARLHFSDFGAALKLRAELEALLPALSSADQARVHFVLGNVARLGYDGGEVAQFQRVLELAPHSAQAMRARMYLAYTPLRADEGDDDLRQAEAIGQRLGSAPLMATLRCAESSRLLAQGRYERCLVVGRRVLESGERLPPALLGAVESDSGRALLAQGRLEEALETLDGCLARYSDWGAFRFIGGTQLNRSAALLGLGRLDEALDAALDALQHGRRCGSIRGQARAHCGAGRVWLAMGERAEVLAELRAARRICGQDPVGLAEIQALEQVLSEAPSGA